jgi:hypothetical protein
MHRHLICAPVLLSLGFVACTADRDWDGSFADPTHGATTGGGDETDAVPDDDALDASTGADDDDDDSTAETIEEAKREFPTYLDLHQKVIVRTCTPDEGVCHNKKEYPDLHTAQTMLGVLGSPCNLDVEDPLAVYNGCEPPGDRLRFVDGNNAEFETEVAWVELVDDEMGDLVSAQIVLRDPIPGGMLDPAAFESVVFSRATANGTLTVGQIANAASYLPGTDLVVVEANALSLQEKTLLETGLQQGDLNRDGVFGASEDPYRMLVPGDPWKSYLLQRLQGNVPGSPMPLANQPLSSAEVIAIACWIEGASAPGGGSSHTEIDYDGCEYAKDFGEPPADSGATFSGHVQPLFDARCSAAGCHGANQPAAGLSLVAGQSRANLLRPSAQNPEVDLVTPGNPTNSYLVTKLTGNGASGVQMPVNGSLSEEEIEMVRLWISYGAPND